jgi:hypothetical protein
MLRAAAARRTARHDQHEGVVLNKHHTCPWTTHWLQQGRRNDGYSLSGRRVHAGRPLLGGYPVRVECLPAD